VLPPIYIIFPPFSDRYFPAGGLQSFFLVFLISTGPLTPSRPSPFFFPYIWKFPFFFALSKISPFFFFEISLLSLPLSPSFFFSCGFLFTIRTPIFSSSYFFDNRPCFPQLLFSCMKGISNFCFSPDLFPQFLPFPFLGSGHPFFSSLNPSQFGPAHSLLTPFLPPTTPFFFPQLPRCFFDRLPPPPSPLLTIFYGSLDSFIYFLIFLFNPQRATSFVATFFFSLRMVLPLFFFSPLPLSKLTPKYVLQPLSFQARPA